MRKLKLKPRRSSSAALAVVVVAALLAPEVGVASQAPEKAKPKLRENSYYYGAFNRRDPFRSLITGEFVRNDVVPLVDLTGVELVGVVKGEMDRFALLEDEQGRSYVLRVGDKVRNGTVVSVGDEQLVARVTTFGQTSTIRLHMVQPEQGVKR